MLKLILVISTLIVVAFSEEAEESRRRERRFSPFWYGFPFGGGAYAGPGGAYAGAGGAYAGPGAYAGAGAGSWSPWFAPRTNWSPYPINFAPFPPMLPFPQAWYEGQNVCKEVRTRNDDTPDDFDDFLKDEDTPNAQADYNHEQESCRGSNTKYTCLKRVTDGTGKSKLEATKYECCHGFIRDPSGAPGCIERAPQPATEAPAQPNGKYYYNILPNDKNVQKSYSSSSSKRVVQKV